MVVLNIFPSTKLYFGSHVLSSERLVETFGQQRVILIADAAIKELYGTALAKKMGAELLTIPSGEKAKTQQTADDLVEKLFKMGAGKDTFLAALGGGATSDLVGFVASIYMRGVPLILIPTTLLALVDAAIGGKTGIDTSYGKNLLGTTYFPNAIFADLDFLQTLPEKEQFNGAMEILKMGLIHKRSIWEMAKNNIKDPDLILSAIEGKIEIVKQDPTDRALRRILNFGHTIAHALEKVSDYEVSHGEAVAWGCVVESHLSMHLGYLAKKDFEEILAMYERFSFKLPKAYHRAKLLAAMAYDKKRALGKIRFVLIDRIGHAMAFEGEYCQTVSETALQPTLDWLETWK